MLELINQSTIAGESIALTYNNQADYVRRIPALINHAVMKIRTTTKPDRRTAELTDGERRGNWILFPLPSNCQNLISGSVFRLTPGGGLEHPADYRIVGSQIWVPDTGRSPRHCPPPDGPPGGDPFPDFPEPVSSGVFVEYTAYPVQLPPDPPDSYPMEETPDVIQAAEYYAAAALVMMEDEFLYSTLMREFEERLEQMRPRITAEFVPVRDVYGFGV